jgi:acyl dehydratase
MPIYYPDILNEPAETRTFSYTEKDVILYALGIGAGVDPLDPADLPFVYEKGLRVIPAVVTALARVGQREITDTAPKMLTPGHRISRTNRLMRVHGEQKVEFHYPVAPSGTVTTETRTINVVDKGEGKGALIVSEALWFDADRRKVATLTTTTFARGDGGFGGPSTGGVPVHTPPARAPDICIHLPTRPDLALLYRLSGDMNPIHADPKIAAAAGFPRPILHGLATFGMACLGIAKTVVDGDVDRIVSQQCRFSAPVLPGDTLTLRLWWDGREVSFEGYVKDRDVTVIKNGKVVLA